MIRNHTLGDSHLTAGLVTVVLSPLIRRPPLAFRHWARCTLAATANAGPTPRLALAASIPCWRLRRRPPIGTQVVSNSKLYHTGVIQLVAGNTLLP